MRLPSVLLLRATICARSREKAVEMTARESPASAT
jgi:hypothetical protein